MPTEYLSACNADDRLRRATELFVKHASITEVTKKIAKSIDESLSKQQKEFFLRQQLAAIQRELNNLNAEGPNGSRSSGSQSELDDNEQSEAEDMAEIRSKIEAMAKDSEERKMAVREWKRLQRIPSGGAEHSVIRNYVSPSTGVGPEIIGLRCTQLEWITSIPWPSSAAYATAASSDKLKDRTFLTNARKQLDEDHYGLDKIKKRLIEYLAVVRLKQLQAEREAVSSDPTLAIVPATPPPNTKADGGNGSSRRVQGDATSRALALISKALNPRTAAGAGSEAKDTKEVSVPQPAPMPSGSKPQRRAAAKAVKGPILL